MVQPAADQLIKFNRMVKTIYQTGITCLLFILTVGPGLASTAEERLLTVGEAAGFGTERSLPVVIGGVIQGVLALVGIIFMTYIIYGGWLWMSGRGEEERIKKAKDTIRASIIGLIIVFSAYIITATVIDRFTQATGYTDSPITDAS
jgi:hypothetical protein